jgi:beta-barrel assembly-enhancing protease
MKHAALVLVLVLAAAPAYAQVGGLGRRIGQARDAKAKVNQLADMVISEKEERAIGENISGLLTNHFGVYQDEAVTKYVTLVGTVVAQASSRPALDWQFIVLDTDGVNAYAAPGGFIHITRGALGLIRTEAELAGVLGHEITHVTGRHTINAIKKSKGVEFTTEHVGGSGLTGAGVSLLGQTGYRVLFENGFDRGDEMHSDEVGIEVANSVGYAPQGMIGFLTKIAERNTDMQEPNGLFASHPQIADRIAAMEKIIAARKLRGTAVVASRYTSHITFEAMPPAAITMNIEGIRGAVGDAKTKDGAADDGKKDEKRKGGLLGSGFRISGGSQAQSSQTVASAGSRGGVPDRDATGGPIKSRLTLEVTAAEIEAFKTGIAG